MKIMSIKIALMAIFGIALAFTFSCSGGEDSSKDSCSEEIPSDLERDINEANMNLFASVQYLSKPSGSVVAESGGNVVVCKEIVEAEISRIKQQIRDTCNEYPGQQAARCADSVIKYASGKDPNTGTPIPDMDKEKAIREGRPIWILESIKTN
ncbi:MAG: hypothetical protein LBC87_06780 [Fibromonadaceae bacterium]|nr:hypothetical protein [Fibromonadaceae bacterium]